MHVRTCRFTPPLTCVEVIASKHTPNLNAIGPAVVKLPMERVSPTPSPRHVPRAVTGTGRYRCRSNTKFIEWWHRTKKTARESVNPFQRYKILKSVTGSGWVGSGRAAHTEISPLNHRTRSALRAPLVTNCLQKKLCCQSMLIILYHSSDTTMLNMV